MDEERILKALEAQAKVLFEIKEMLYQLLHPPSLSRTQEIKRQEKEDYENMLRKRANKKNSK
jgi:hypothetical protein